MTAICLLYALWFCPDERVISAELLAPLPPVRVEMPATRYRVRAALIHDFQPDKPFATREFCEVARARVETDLMPEDGWRKVVTCEAVR